MDMCKANIVGVALDGHTKHVVVKAYANVNLLYSAVQYLLHWEASTPAPLSAYTLLMEHLLKHPVREVHALAWSVYYHMRLAAHAVPDAAVYAMMIRACAAGVPQPRGGRRRGGAAPEADAERALDLFREMTTHYAIRPNKEVYDSLILTCARRKDHYSDALRLLRELVDSAGDAAWPDVYTFNAVLQGSARTGDLRTARWILAEMLQRTMVPGDGDVRRRPTDETMANLFWAYAVYDPPIAMESIRMAEDVSAAAASDAPRDADAPQRGSEMDRAPPAADKSSRMHLVADNTPAADESAAERPAFTHGMPQTAQDVLVEARALMARILADQGGTDGVLHPLASVRPTPRLLNAFLAVLAHHLRPEKRLAALVHAVEDADGPFAQAGVEPNGHSLAMVLSACTTHRARAHADRVAERMWQRWMALSRASDAAHPGGRSAAALRDLGTDAKATSKMWALMIRNAAKSFRVDEGLHLLREFFERFPPAVAERTSPAREVAKQELPPLDLAPVQPSQSLLAALYALPRERVAPGHYAPLAPHRPRLLFRDLELLHHRCIALRNVRGLNLITRVDRAYRQEPL